MTNWTCICGDPGPCQPGPLNRSNCKHKRTVFATSWVDGVPGPTTASCHECGATGTPEELTGIHSKYPTAAWPEAKN